MMSRPQVNSSSSPVSIPSAAPDPALNAAAMSFRAKMSSARRAPRKGITRSPTTGVKRLLPTMARR